MFTIRSREPSSIVKPLKTANPTPEAENKQNEKLDAAKPKAVRHLILVRHGQYNLNGATDAQRFLTDVGRQQAEFTGDRLKALEIPWDRMVKSTMQRAQETGKIIAQKVGDGIPTVDHCSLIEEGAPIAPEPPIGHWRPEPSVCAYIYYSEYVCWQCWLMILALFTHQYTHAPTAIPPPCHINIRQHKHTHTHIPTAHQIQNQSRTPANPHSTTLQQFFQDGARIEAGFRKYFHRAEPDQAADSYTLIVCHANVIRYFVCR